MKLQIDSNVIADSDTDSKIKSLSVSAPVLSFSNTSTTIRGMSFARNRQQAWGLAFTFDVVITRQFESYEEAQSFDFSHIANFTNGASGRLTIIDMLGCENVFDNAILESVEVVEQTGVSSQIKYAIKTGKSMSLQECAILVNGYIVTQNDTIITVKNYV